MLLFPISPNTALLSSHDCLFFVEKPGPCDSIARPLSKNVRCEEEASLPTTIFKGYVSFGGWMYDSTWSFKVGPVNSWTLDIFHCFPWSWSIWTIQDFLYTPGDIPLIEHNSPANHLLIWNPYEKSGSHSPYQLVTTAELLKHQPYHPTSTA